MIEGLFQNGGNVRKIGDKVVLAREFSGEPRVLVVASPPRPTGRHREPRPNAVGARARVLGLPLLETDGPLVPPLAEAEPDAIVVVAFGRLLPQAALDLARVAPLNVHFSLLPDLRGASPVESAILRGDERTGVSVIRMTAELDAGPVFAAREVAIEPDDDAGRLGGRLAVLGAHLLVDTLDALAGKVVLVRWWTAPTCPYCAATAPALNEFHETFRAGRTGARSARSGTQPAGRAARPFRRNPASDPGEASVVRDDVADLRLNLGQ